RLDLLQGWLEQQVGWQPQAVSDCGAISSVGRCFDGRAVWCDSGRLQATACTGTQMCGWHSATSSYRCVEPGVDWSGADALWTCTESTVRRCGPGLDQRIECGSCSRCGFDSVTGAAGCFPLVDP